MATMIEIGMLVQQMTVFALLFAIGVIATKTGVLTDSSLNALTKLIVNITLPALIITLVPSSAGRNEILNSYPFLLVSFALIGLLFLIGKLTAKITGLRGETAKVHTAETTFGNVGFIGIPLIEALFGKAGIFFVSIFSLADHTLLWTLGTYLTSGGQKKSGLKRLINPMTVTLVVALIFCAFNFRLTGIIYDTLNGLGGTTKYLSMIYIGGSLTRIDFRTIYKRVSVFLTVALKMIATPVAVYLLASNAGWLFNRTGTLTLTILAALPSMTTIAILARANGSDHTYASECVFITTIFGFFTIPLVVWIVSFL